MIADDHRLAAQVEKLLTVRIPGIERVLVHGELEGDIDPLAQPGGGT